MEARNFEIRKNVLKYDDVMTGQRETIYAERRKVLEGEDMGPQMRAFMESLVTGLVDEAIVDKPVDEWDLPTLWEHLRAYYPPSRSRSKRSRRSTVGAASLVRDDLVTELVGDIHAVYADTEDRLNANPLAQAQLGDEPIRTLERRVVISVVDRLWREHLYEMDYLKEGIGLRAMGQRDPLVEYKDEGAQMFQAMVERIREESVQQVFSYAKQFERALAAAEEEAGGSIAAASVAPAQEEAASSEDTEPSVEDVAAAESAATAAAREAVAHARSVMGNVGRAKAPNRVSYSSAEGAPVRPRPRRAVTARSVALPLRSVAAADRYTSRVRRGFLREPPHPFCVSVATRGLVRQASSRAVVIQRPWYSSRRRARA